MRTAWEKDQMARKMDRPKALDYIKWEQKKEAKEKQLQEILWECPT